MKNVIKQSYQTEVLLKTVDFITVGSRYPFKDNVVISTENILPIPDMELFSFTQRIDICIPCENRIIALQLVSILKTHFDSGKNLALIVSIFQKPFTRDNQKSRKHFSYSIFNAKQIMENISSLTATPKILEDDKSYIASNYELTYSILDFYLEHLFLTEIDGVKLDKPFYKLKLYTTTIIENIDEKNEISTSDELVVFEINGDSETEIIALAKILTEIKDDYKKSFTSGGNFPKNERDFFTIRLNKTAAEFLEIYKKKDVVKEKK